ANHRSKLAYLVDCLRFVHSKSDFKDATPLSLVEFQKSASKDDEYKILDIVQEYILKKGGRHKTLTTRHSVIRNFFLKNRAALPLDPFKVKATVPKVDGRLSFDSINSFVSDADLEMRAFYLTFFMGIFDEERFRLFNETQADRLVEHLKSKGVDEPFRFDFPGRKEGKYKEWYYTYIGRDALTAWKEYFERRRGYPKKGEALILDRDGKPLGKAAMGARHLRMLENLRFIKRKGGGASTRYGYNLHEFRDVAKTLLHLQGKRDGLDLDCVDFWMGHTIDNNQYDKFYRDKNYSLEQYRIAEKHLNIISGIQSTPTQDTKELAQQIIKNPEAFKVLQDAMVEIVGAKLAPIEGKRKG
ncbi:MAG: hypothetical protein WBF08_02680, partial [Candidatus Bathyarchaeia archaeon]